MIRKKNNKLERDKLIDGFFNQNWCCDLDEVKNAVFDTINELEKANDINATRVIELTQKIDKAIEKVKDIWFTLSGDKFYTKVILKDTESGKELLKILGDKE